MSDELSKQSWWHRFVHRRGWNRGKVVSWTTDGSWIKIGFQCSQCGVISGVIDATGIIDRHIALSLAIPQADSPQKEL